MILLLLGMPIVMHAADPARRMEEQRKAEAKRRQDALARAREKEREAQRRRSAQQIQDMLAAQKLKLYGRR